MTRKYTFYATIGLLVIVAEGIAQTDSNPTPPQVVVSSIQGNRLYRQINVESIQSAIDSLYSIFTDFANNASLIDVNHGTQVLTTSGIWVVPSGVRMVELEFYGGSGGDAGNCWCHWANSYRYGSNGSNGGGGKILLSVAEGDTITYSQGQHGLDDAGPYNGPGQYSSYTTNGKSGLNGVISTISVNGTEIASANAGIGGTSATCTPSPGPGQCFNGGSATAINGFAAVNTNGGGIVLSESNKNGNELIIRY
jgi:hypothetical protein